MQWIILAHTLACLNGHQDENIVTLCGSVTSTALELHPSLHTSAQDIASRYSKAFQHFGKCHNIYETNYVDENQVQEQGKYGTMITISFSTWFNLPVLTSECIEEFMEFYRTVSHLHRQSKAPRVGRSCSATVEGVESWVWASGRTGSRIYTCSFQLPQAHLLWNPRQT